VATRFPQEQEPVLTDISLRVFPHSGEIRFFDDEENELMRIVIPEWIKGSREEDFYQKVTPILQEAISGVRQEVIDNMSLLRPYSFVLQDEDGETLSDLYLVDDQETMILSGTLLEGLDDDLNTFFENLMKE
jgi:hypothetical protein